MSDEDEIAVLEERWRTAELAGDGDALAELSAPEFRLVGPLGFVLDRAQWLVRYTQGLSTTALDWREVDVRVIGSTAITIGVHDQQASYQGRPADGAFRSTHVHVRTDDGWRLALVQLSPIAQPPAP